MGPKSLQFLLRRLPQLSPSAQAGGRTPATAGRRSWQHLSCARFKGVGSSTGLGVLMLPNICITITLAMGLRFPLAG